MLHAIVARKARLEKILGNEAKRHPCEDLITSALFGTLSFLEPDDRGQVLNALTGWKGESCPEIYLWESFNHGSRCEPDVLLVERTDAGALYWIVESKWGAPLGGGQIVREIVSVQHGTVTKERESHFPISEQHACRNVVGYTLFGYEKTRHEHEIEAAKPMLPLSPFIFQTLDWRAIRRRLERLQDSADARRVGLRAWLQVTIAFLRDTPKGSAFSGWPQLLPVASGGYTLSRNAPLFFEDPLASVRDESFCFHLA